MGLHVATACVQRDVLGHGCMGVQVNRCVAGVDGASFGKIHQQSSESQALGVRCYSEVVQQQSAFALEQDSEPLNLPGVVQHVNAAGLDQQLIVLKHRPGLAADPLDVGRVGGFDNGLDGSNVIRGGVAHHCSVLL